MATPTRRYVVDPLDPRAPDQETWALLSEEERRLVVADLDEAALKLEENRERARLEAMARADELGAKLDAANQRIAALEAELKRRGG